MIQGKKFMKIITVLVIITFIFQSDILYPQKGRDLEKQFQKAKNAYIHGHYDDSRKRIERIIGIIGDKSLDRKDILGKCFLLLGATCEKEGDLILAEANYRKAKEKYDIQSIDGVDLENLAIYKKVIKGQKGKIEKEKKKIKKKFPWLLVASGVVIVVVAAILLLKKKKKTYNLTVTRGEGVDGTPNSGTTTYDEGSTVNYSYSAQSGYANLVVTLDGVEVSASGTITMDRHHTLTATALNQYTLDVTKGTGVDGYPDSGTTTLAEGYTVDYSYSLQNGYTGLVVQLDGETVAASGTITMNSNHELTASAAIERPVVTITSHSNGQTVSGRTNIEAKVDSERAIDRVELHVNDDITVDRDPPYSFIWKTKKYEDGTYNVKVVAYDSENLSGEDQVSLEVYNGPYVDIIYPSNDAIVSGRTTIEASASSIKGIDRVEFYVDDIIFLGSASSEPYKKNWDPSTYEQGPHTIQAVAYDNAGNNNKDEIQVEVRRGNN